jgi:tRNA pseudouridine32 synthase/23S rRNA pseudouridine746 synthase
MPHADVTWLDGPDLPPASARLPSPFDEGPPAALAVAAMAALRARAAAWPEVHAAGLDAPGGGKMFGVLVVRAGDGRLGALRAFSGTLAGAWHHPGWCPPLHDPATHDAILTAGAPRMQHLTAVLAALDHPRCHAALAGALAAVDATDAAALAALDARHQVARADRHQQRAGLLPDDDAARHRLAQASRADTVERRRLLAAQAAARAPLAAAVARWQRRRRALELLRAAWSRHLQRALHDAVVVRDRAGAATPLRALFAPGEPATGAGECAAPRLLAAAFALGLTPVALAEQWWGAPPATGARVDGAFYPACARKCGVIVPHLLRGLDVAPARRFAPPVLAPAPLEVVYEDAWLIAISKPVGLLSVPARDLAIRDSALVRLRARLPDATGPLLVHRLDLDTSGVLLACKDLDTYRRVQAQFADRTVGKRYLAVVAGVVAGDEGQIELPLRVDLDDRPRQIVDPVHGRAAITSWRVLARARGGATTRLELRPHTGRTHQLRVHCAHPSGLGAPIVGDRLYGHAPGHGEGDRLLLHAEELALTHPHTGARLVITAPASF